MFLRHNMKPVFILSLISGSDGVFLQNPLRRLRLSAHSRDVFLFLPHVNNRTLLQEPDPALRDRTTDSKSGLLTVVLSNDSLT